MKFGTISALVTLMIALAFCSGGSKKETVVLEGWKTENGIDTFYMTYSATGSENAKNKGNPAMLRETCREAARVGAADNLVRAMIGETIESTSGSVDAEASTVLIVSKRTGIVKGLREKECTFETPEDVDKQQCTCILYVSGKNMRKDFEFEVKKAQEGK